MDETVRFVLCLAAAAALAITALMRATELNGKATVSFGGSMLAIAVGSALWGFEIWHSPTTPSWAVTVLVVSVAHLVIVRRKALITEWHAIESVSSPIIRMAAITAALIALSMSGLHLPKVEIPFARTLPFGVEIYSARIENVRQGNRPVLVLDAKVNRRCDTIVTLRLRPLAAFGTPIDPAAPMYVFKRDHSDYAQPGKRRKHYITLPDKMTLPPGMASGTYNRLEPCHPGGPRSIPTVVIPPFEVKPPAPFTEAKP